MRFGLLMIWMLYACLAFGQQDSFMRIGARTAGMAYANAAMQDINASFHNPAGLSYLQESQAGFNYEYRFGLEELSTLSAVGALHTKNGVASLALARFGGELFNIQRASLSFSNQFGLASLGARINVDQIRMQDFGQRMIASIDFGGMAKLTKDLHFGAFIRNLSQASFEGLQEEYVPTVLALGIGYQPTSGVFLTAEVEKDLELPTNVKAGVEYLLREIVFLRAGFQSKPVGPHFGLGFLQPSWQLDYAMHKHLALGYIHQVSFRLHFTRENRAP